MIPTAAYRECRILAAKYPALRPLWDRLEAAHVAFTRTGSTPDAHAANDAMNALYLEASRLGISTSRGVNWRRGGYPR